MTLLLLGLLLGLLAGLTAHADPGHATSQAAEVQWAWRDDSIHAGDWVAAASPSARICANPQQPCAGPAVALGTNLIVTSLGPREARPAVPDPSAPAFAQPGPRPTRWLQVATAAIQEPGDPPLYAASGEPLGWLPSDQVTQAAWRRDLSGDGAEDVVVARFDDRAQVEVLVQVSGVDPAQRLDLGARTDIEGPQGVATVTWMAPGVAGIPLLRVRWHAREQCGSGDAFAYASLRGAPPTLRQALRHRGSGGDAPIWWDTTIAFSARDTTAIVEERSGEHGDDGVRQHRRLHYRLQDGVFEEVRVEQLTDL